MVAYNLIGSSNNVTNIDSGSAASSHASIQNGNQDLRIRGFAFSPNEIRVSAGTTVTWTNEDSASHTVTSDSGKELDSQTFGKSGTYSYTFNEKGTYNYHCTIHSGMKGKVVVE